MNKLRLALALLLLALAGLSEAAAIPSQSVTVNGSFAHSNDAYNAEDGFRVYRCAGVGCTPTTLIQTLPANTFTFTDVIDGDVGGSSHTYGVSAYNAKGESDKALVTIITPAILIVPGAPSGLIATVVGVTIK